MKINVNLDTQQKAGIFVEKAEGEWWAVLKDVCDALDLKARFAARRLEKDVLSKHTLETEGGPQEMLIVSEFGIYETIFASRKPEARQFRQWVFEIIKELRKATGIEGFAVFRLMDKEQQKKAMQMVKEGTNPSDAVNYIKANMIANKAISNRYGYPKAIKKKDMSPQMLHDRQPILEDTVELMTIQSKYDVEISVSDAIYRKWSDRL